MAVFGRTDLQPFHPVVQREIEPVFKPLFMIAVFTYIIICIGNRILKRIAAETEVPFSVAVDAVEVDAGNAGRGHMWHVQAACYGIADFNLWRIAVEMDGKSGRMARQVPDRFAHHTIGTFRQAGVSVSDFLCESLVLDNRKTGFHRIMPFPLGGSRKEKKAAKQ